MLPAFQRMRWQLMEQAAHGLRPALSVLEGVRQAQVAPLMTAWTAWLSRPCSCR